jgi:glycosyltransferase involved in cell wall biosynthesis
VLLFSSFAHLGQGGQESLFQLATRLDRNRFRPSVVVPSHGSLSQRLTARGIDVHALDLPKVAMASLRDMAVGLHRLSALINREGMDILHTDGPRNTFYAGVVGRLKRKPVVWHVRSSEPDPYDRFFCFLSTKIILVAEALAFRFPGESQKAKCVTIHNGVDLKRFAPLTHLSLKPSSPYFESPSIIIVHTGRVEPQKGQRQLVEACGRLRDQVPQLRIVFAGEIRDEEYFKECLQCASNMGVRERIRFIGHQEDVSALLQASDIFGLPSIRGEAFSRSILEAMATGKPVVATSCGGAAEAIIDNSSGFIVSPADSAALAERIALLAAREELRNQMGRAARTRAETFFGIEENVERTVRVYEEVLRGR